MKIISKDEVKHVAKLAEITFEDKELEKITLQLDKILSHVAKISIVDTSGAQSTSYTLDIKNIFRHDEVKDSLSRDDALKNAPEEAQDGFLVPRID